MKPCVLHWTLSEYKLLQVCIVFPYWVKKITIKDKTDLKLIQEQNKNVT